MHLAADHLPDGVRDARAGDDPVLAVLLRRRLRAGRGPQAGYMSGSQFPYNSQTGARRAGRRQERRADRGDHLVLTNPLPSARGIIKMKSEMKKRAFWCWPAARCCCSAASSRTSRRRRRTWRPGRRRRSAAGRRRRPRRRRRAWRWGRTAGRTALIDDGEDGNNQNLPNDNRGGYWYTFKDKGTTTVEPTAGEEGGTFAMSEGGHDSQYAARYHGHDRDGRHRLFGAWG